MSKKKRRYKKKQRKRVGPNVSDNHHIFWTRRSYSQHPWALKLRNHPYCIVLIPKNSLHKEIHQQIVEVPLPKEIVCEDVCFELNRLWEFGAITKNDSIIQRLNLLIFMMRYVADDTVEALEKQKELASR